MLVVNAANRDGDHAWIREHAEPFDVDVIDRSDELALLALQGPRAEEVLVGIAAADLLEDLGYYHFAEGSVAGMDTIISRTGYTGEDGFELYLSAEESPSVWRAILDAGRDRGLQPAGLGARDSLRLEMGYALYGNDLDEEHTPLEAGLGWITKLEKGTDFIGRAALVRQQEQGVEERLVGLRLEERGFPRAGYAIIDDDEDVGTVTSGTVSPVLDQGIALGYVRSGRGEPGTELAVRIRGDDIPAIVVRPPFYTDGSLRR